MYYIQKCGVYMHGVYWIGEDLEYGIVEANKLAKEDTDDYHTWEVFRISEGNLGDYAESIYSTSKSKQGV